MSRTRIAFAVFAATAFGVVAIGAPATATEARAAKAKDITVLFDKALKIVRANPDFAKAVVLEADGTPRGGSPVMTAAGITNWRFVFQNGSSSSDFLSVTLKYSASKGFAKPKGHKSPFLEDVVLKKAPKMTLTEAVEILSQAGYDVGFDAVTLRNPLGPEASQPLYIFSLVGGGFVGVNTKTGDVARSRPDPLSPSRRNETAPVPIRRLDASGGDAASRAASRGRR